MSQIRSDVYFAIIPEWVLHANISANAVRLYCILNRYANSQGKAWPSRTSIAEKMGVSKATIDRAKEELEAIGAISIDKRISPNGDPTSNLYTLHTQPMSSQVMRGSPTDDDRGSPTDDDLNRVSMNESHKKLAHHLCERCHGRKVVFAEATETEHGWFSPAPTPCPECR